MKNRPTDLLPGLALCGAVAIASILINRQVPLLSSMLLAVLTGLVLRNIGLIPGSAEAGIALSGRTLLRLGVVLLGLRLSISAVLALGWGAVAVIVMTVTTVFLGTLGLGRLLGLGRATCLLTATGTAICGAAAVAGVSAVVRPGPGARQDEVEEAAATAVATVTLYGTLAVLLMPLAVGALGLPAVPAGVWVGASVHEVGQVTATAGVIGGEVLDAAVVAKLGRVALLAPLVALVGVAEGRRARREQQHSIERSEVSAVLAGAPVPHPSRVTPVVPLFVLGFLAAVALRSVAGGILPSWLLAGAETTSGLLLTMAMCSMGAGVNLRRLASAGLPALGLGAGATAIAVLVSLAGVLMTVG
ncbi:YeiH family protein [Actinomyces gaoshouyii]|uniref:Membrane protein n=1 Tax=Actinomyces gaoshouyii TaxID=1960083 RepID=A0A8H9LE06_9ACTO|nr:putative sulfate exporter family transporter [Actinomyces gaoshouyii]GGO94952.1 membrane protein [Actinomyces gaoshouyii]